MPQHVVHFMRSISADTLVGLQNVCLGALKEGATELAVHMSSDGGGTDQGFAAYHFLRSLPIPLTTHCIGNVESMAVMMFLAGQSRFIVPHGRVKIHPMHWGFNAGTVDHDRLTEHVACLDFDAKRYRDIYQERTTTASHPVDVFSHLMGQAKLLGAADAKNAGIATEIADVALQSAATIWWV